MNKKLLAVAVAGALAAPGVALAQASSVTISGIFKVGVENIKYDSVSASRLNSSQTRVVDNSSRILFNVEEGLGNGLSAVAQLDLRFSPDQAATVQTSNAIGGGNTWVGLKSTKWGRLTMGRHDLHYGKAPDDTAAKAGALEASAVSIFDYINGTAIANGSRTQNVVRYDMPSYSGFDMIVAWSANPSSTSEIDMLSTAGSANFVTATPSGIPGVLTGVTTLGATAPVAGVTQSRKGDGWNVNPQYTNGPFQIGYSYWNAKPDAPLTTSTDQRSDVLYGYYKWGDFKIGLGWNKSKLENSSGITQAATGNAKVAERQAWSIPVSYVMGPHNFVGHYTWAEKNKALINSTDTGAKMFSLAYVYDLSRRTSLGLTYSQLKNEANAAYNFFTSTSLGSTDTTVLAGERPRLVQATLKHAF
jgi:predicted porin